MSRIALLILIQWTIVGWGFTQEIEPARYQVESWRNRIKNNNKDLLQDLFDLQEQTAMVEQLIPELTVLLKEGSEPVRRLAVRCLHQVGEKASPAAASLVFNLDHRDYLIRSEVMETLRAIGPIAIPELQEALKSPSPRIRASALSTLNSIGTVDAALLEQLQNDPDSRVRIGVAQAWKKHGKRGVERMVSYLNDSESVVATGAALSLRFHFEDSEMAVKHLSESLSRKDSAYASALALQSFGVEAQIAIPQLIRSIPLGIANDFSQFSREEMVSTVLSRIGPPRLADLESLRQLLTDANSKKRTTAARMIGHLGTEAIDVAPQLEHLFQLALLEHLKVKEQASSIADEFERERFLAQNDVNEYSCLQICTSYWRVSRNTERYVQMIEQLATQSESAINLAGPPFAECSEQDVPHLRRMLESSNLHVRETSARSFLNDPPNETVSFEAVLALRKLGCLDGRTLQSDTMNRIRNVGPLILPWLIEDLNRDALTLKDFAQAVASLKICTPEVETILTNGLNSPDPYTCNSCLAGLAAIASDEQESVRILLSNAEKKPEFRYTSLKALLKQHKASELAVSFSIECLNDPELWVRRYAISLLARIGPAASKCIPELTELAQNIAIESERRRDNEAEMRLAIALTCVSGDKSEFNRRFEQAMSDPTEDGWRTRSLILDLLKELGPDGDSFMDEITRLILFASSHREEDQFTLELGLKLLAIVGSPRSIELLKSFRLDRDWQVRTKAKRILRMIDGGTELYYDTYIP